MQFSKRIFITLTSVLVMVLCVISSNVVLAKASPNQSAREYPIEVHEMVKARLAAQRRTSSGNSNQGAWGSWSQWSPCSRSCGGGVATQSRECESTQQPVDTINVEDTKRRRRVPLLDRTPPRLDNVTSSSASPPRGRKSQCVGLYKRFHLCNSQPCPLGSKDFRQSQCEAFNGKLFMGRYYMWEPFLDAPNPCVLNCRAVGFRFYATLNQSVVDGTACHIATPPHHVPEKNNEPWICVAGQCKHVGCDGVVGSDKRWDACGECGGTNSSCRLFSGLFSNHANLQAGYNLITTLPRGACNISVSEMTPSRSYLALRRPSGQFLLNGDWQINWAGEYDAGGVTFVYRPQDAARGEALTARGPLLEPVDLMVLYQQSNLAIKYEYTLPVSAGMPPITPPVGPAAAPPVIRSPHGVTVQQAPSHGHHGGGHHHGGHHHGGTHHQPAPPLFGYNPSNPDDVTVRDGPFNDGADTRRHSVAPSYPFSGTGPVGDEAQPPVAALRPRNRKVRKFVWRHVSFSECSKSCGGGMQTATAICVREYNQAPVPEKRCQGQERPPPQMVRCNNKPCPAEWEAGEWGPCSTTCGSGIQSRSVVCRQHISASLTMKVAEGACLGPVMERTRRCQLKPCSSSGARWAISDWGPCTAPCGKGSRTRIVRCVATDGNDLTPESCNSDERPEEQESCDAGPCSHNSASGISQWLVSEWAQRCSEECGTGVQTRRVICSVGSEHACDAAARPEASRACSSDKQCSGKWFAGPWGQCSASCGQGRQSRDVVCVAFVRGQFRVALDMNCPTSLKPAVERACSERPCGPEWFMGDWGSCSHNCGTGSQRREVRCLDETQRPSSSCGQELRPTSHRACNTHACERGHTAVAETVDRGSSSEDEQNAVAPREHLHARAHHNVVPASSTSHHGGGHLQAHDAHEDSGGAGDQASSHHDDEDQSKGPDCVDKFPNCHLVVQARLCRYKYYRNACCISCHRKSG